MSEFIHSSSARRDPKIRALRASFGNSAEPYAWYFLILEMLGENIDHKILLDEKGYEMLMNELNVDRETLKRFITISKKLGLFNVVDNYLFSPVFRIIDRKIKYFRDTRLRGSDAHWKSSEHRVDEQVKQDILECWNRARIIRHRKMTTKAEVRLRSALKDYTIEEIKKAIINYGKIVNNPKYFFKYKWTLEEFLMRGIAKFVNDECFKNFLSNKKVYVPYKEEENDDIKF